MLFEPVVGVALAAWLLGEALVPIQLVGAAAILAAALLLQRSARGAGAGPARPSRPRRTVGTAATTAMSPRPAPIRVLLVDDHAMVRRGMRDFLVPARRPRDRRRGGRRRRGHRAAAALRPDVVVMDLLMPGVDGIDATARIKAADPDVEIVAITSFIEEARIVAALEAGASGFLLKDAEADELAAAIRAAASGEVHLDPAVAGIVARRMRDGAAAARVAAPARARDRSATLTARERDVLGGGRARPARTARSRTSSASRSGPRGRTCRTSWPSSGSPSRTQAALLAVQHGLDRPA